MARQNFYDIIKNAAFNTNAEYERIACLYHSNEYGQDSLCDLISGVFLNFPESFRGRTISIDDFNRTYGFNFPTYQRAISVEELITYCEYITNLCNQLVAHCDYVLDDDIVDTLKLIHQTINGCMDEIGQVPVQKDGITIFVEKDSAAISVAEIVDDELVFPIMEYHHYRLKGDLSRKKAILKLFADDIEGERTKLRGINGTLESQLYQLMNKFVRHDHSQTPYISTMSPESIEACYDDIYQMWLLAKLELDHLDRKRRVGVLLSEING